MDLLTLLSNLGSSFLPALNVVFALMGLFGLWIGFVTTFHVYLHATGEVRPDMVRKEMILPAYALAGALAVPGVVLWKSAGTFVLGGQKTYDMFAYLQSAPVANYCDNATNALTKFFMLLGAISILIAANNVWGRVGGDSHAHSNARAWTYFVGGVLLFFVNDVAEIVAATAKVPVGLPQICAALTAA